MKHIMKRIIEFFAIIIAWIFEYGAYVSIPLFILFCIFPIFRNPFVLGIVVTHIVVMAGAYFFSIVGGIGYVLFDRYAKKYDELVDKGDDKAIAFAKTSFKAIGIFISAILLILFLIYISPYLSES